MRQANPQSLALHENEYSSPDNKTTDRWPAIAAAIPRYARDAPTKSPPPPKPPKSKWSTKPATYIDIPGALQEAPEVQNLHPPFHPFRRIPLFRLRTTQLPEAASCANAQVLPTAHQTSATTPDAESLPLQASSR